MKNAEYQISISSDTMDRLKALAEPFVDTPDAVIRRLLDHGKDLPTTVQQGKMKVDSPASSRVPRERGIVVLAADRQFTAVSVRDLYAQVLEWLVDKHEKSLAAQCPMKTSQQRYLVAKEPIHPTGNSFVVPVEYHGYFMESHKDYKNAIAHLSSLLARLGMPFRTRRATLAGEA